MFAGTLEIRRVFSMPVMPIPLGPLSMPTYLPVVEARRVSSMPVMPTPWELVSLPVYLPVSFSVPSAGWFSTRVSPSTMVVMKSRLATCSDLLRLLGLCPVIGPGSNLTVFAEVTLAPDQ